MAKTSMYAIDRSEEYLAHYGIKGMKWGVRKAIASGGTGLGNRRLARQYRKAQKKLAKLEKRANNGAKYARRAAALGAGAAAAGGLAALGTGGVSSAMAKIGAHGGKALGTVGNALKRGPAQKLWDASIAGRGKAAVIGTAAARKLYSAGDALSKAGGSMSTGLYKGSQAVRNWGNATGLSVDNAYSRAIRSHANRATNQAQQALANGIKNNQIANGVANQQRLATKAANLNAKANAARTGFTNNQLARAGAAALGLGLAGAAGYNAYRAATTKRAAKKAAEFRKEMNKTFAGTAYGKQGGSSSGNKKRRRR